MSIGVYGFDEGLWLAVDVYGCLSVSMGVGVVACGHVSVCEGSYKFPCVYGCQCVFIGVMGFHGCPWIIL